MEFAELFTMLGLDTGTVVSVATVVYGGVALLRSEIPGDLMKGWTSKAVGVGMALFLSWKAMPAEGSMGTMAVTGVVAWGCSMLPHKLTKGTALEIKRNGKG